MHGCRFLRAREGPMTAWRNALSPFDVARPARAADMRAKTRRKWITATECNLCPNVVTKNPRSRLPGSTKAKQESVTYALSKSSDWIEGKPPERNRAVVPGVHAGAEIGWPRAISPVLRATRKLAHLTHLRPNLTSA
jgi:hypothetical protein